MEFQFLEGKVTTGFRGQPPLHEVLRPAGTVPEIVMTSLGSRFWIDEISLYALDGSGDTQFDEKFGWNQNDLGGALKLLALVLTISIALRAAESRLFPLIRLSSREVAEGTFVAAYLPVFAALAFVDSTVVFLGVLMLGGATILWRLYALLPSDHTGQPIHFLWPALIYPAAQGMALVAWGAAGGTSGRPLAHVGFWVAVLAVWHVLETCLWRFAAGSPWPDAVRRAVSPLVFLAAAGFFVLRPEDSSDAASIASLALIATIVAKAAVAQRASEGRFVAGLLLLLWTIALLPAAEASVRQASYTWSWTSLTEGAITEPTISSSGFPKTSSCRWAISKCAAASASRRSSSVPVPSHRKNLQAFFASSSPAAATYGATGWKIST
ncbi:MAG: hypothetical protein M5R36_20290 [Deltaproteobacteria bacterium]|nr:hypothetical protein [Deltaproteobacteria bacterium]